MTEPRDPHSWPGFAFRILTGEWWPLIRAVLILAIVVALGVAALLLLDTVRLPGIQGVGHLPCDGRGLIVTVVGCRHGPLSWR